MQTGQYGWYMLLGLPLLLMHGLIKDKYSADLEAANLGGAHQLQCALEGQAHWDALDALPQPLHLLMPAHTLSASQPEMALYLRSIL